MTIHISPPMTDPRSTGDSIYYADISLSEAGMVHPRGFTRLQATGPTPYEAAYKAHEFFIRSKRNGSITSGQS